MEDLKTKQESNSKRFGSMNKEELKNQIEQYRDQNTDMLRKETPKSERRKSVLCARIETLSWVLSLLEDLT